MEFRSVEFVFYVGRSVDLAVYEFFLYSYDLLSLSIVLLLFLKRMFFHFFFPFLRAREYSE